MTRFVEIAYGSFSNRGVVIPEDELHGYAQKAAAEGKELYHSLFTYDESIVQHLKHNKTVRGYTGGYGISQLVLDLDKKSSTDAELCKRAYELAEELSQTWGSYPNVWYSGTGYHFQLADLFGFRLSKDLPEVVKSTLAKHFPWCDHIYHRTGIIRAPYSFNAKSGRYKIPVSADELRRRDHIAIITRATNKPTDTTEIPLPPTEETFPQLIVTAVTKKKTEVSPLTLSKFVTCMQKAYNHGEEEGSRHQRILRMTAAWRHQGLPYEVALDAMIRYAPSLSPPEIERIVHDTYKTGYHQYRCDDPIMQQFCDPMCVWYKNKNFGTPIVSAAQAEKKFVAFLKSDAFKQALNLKNIYKIPTDYFIFPGEVVAVTGDTKLGKSSWMQNIMLHIKTKILHLSLENSEQLTYRRYVQIHHDMSRDDVFKYYMQNTNTLSDAFSHINILSVSPNAEDMGSLIANTDAKVVLVDTLDSVSTYGQGENERLAKIITLFKDLAERMQLIIFVVHHISKSGALDADGNPKPLNIHSMKYASAIEQKADKIIGLEGAQNQPVRTIRSLGARDEDSFVIRATFNTRNLRFTQIV